MTTPTFATSRPAALTGTVGRGGANRPHDVALVQALLGAKKDKRTRPYLRGHVTGRFDPETAQALQRFRADAGDTNAARPLGPRGPVLGKLAQGQALAVLAGTTVPFVRATLPGPGRIAGPAAGHLDAARKAALETLLGALAEDWGLAFDAEVAAVDGSDRSIPAAVFESRPLVARVLPRSLALHDGARRSPVASATMLRACAKALHAALAADISARCARAFALADPVDVEIQQGVKDELGCVVRTDLEGVEALARFLLAEGRKRGFDLAVRFFEHYLGRSGSPIALSREEALAFDLIRNAVQENIERFKQRNFIAPEPQNLAFSAIDSVTENPNVVSGSFQDHWQVDLNESLSGIQRFLVAAVTDLRDTASALLGPGQSSLISCGRFSVQREGNQIHAKGTITHVWTDQGYDFEPGKSFHGEARILEKPGRAKPFKWEARWSDAVAGEMLVPLPRTRLGEISDARRRWHRFEVSPGGLPDPLCGISTKNTQ